MSRSQANEKTSTLLECAISATPTIVSHPPTYIGLRTARYGPKATKVRAGGSILRGGDGNSATRSRLGDMMLGRHRSSVKRTVTVITTGTASLFSRAGVNRH